MAEQIGPSYRRVADDIRSRIASGELAVGTLIPSTKALQERYGQSETVVRRAVRELQNHGILVGHPGKGVYVKATPEQAAQSETTLETLSEEIAGLREQVSKSGQDDLVARVDRIEANLILLFGMTGNEYPGDGAKAAARRGRRR